MSSRKTNPRYTREQYERAKYNSSALEYAKAQGYELIREGGGYYRMKEHDSMIFTPQGSWFWNSRGLHGGAIEFQIYYEGKTVPEAVLTLCGENTLQAENSPVPASEQPPEAKKEFIPPARADHFKRLFGYLCGTRGLEKSVVQDMIQQRVLYESIYRPPRGGGEFHNACFLCFDDDGKPCGAMERGTNTFGTSYKGDVPGSDKRYGWLFHGGGTTRAVAVFESPIDAASYVSLCRMDGAASENLDYLALGGLDDKALFHYLAARPEIRDVALCLDADEPGRAAAERIARKLTERGCSAVNLTNLPESCKDWNEYLVQIRQQAGQAIEQAPMELELE